MADGDPIVLQSSTKDTASLLSGDSSSAATTPKRIRQPVGGGGNGQSPMLGSTGQATASSSPSSSPVGLLQPPSADRSKKHLTVTFSSGRRIGDGNGNGGGGASAQAAVINEEDSVSFTSRDSNRRNGGGGASNDPRASYISTTSSGSSGGASTLSKNQRSTAAPTNMSFDNYAGPIGGAGGGGGGVNPHQGSDLAKFLRDDSIWRDVKVDFAANSATEDAGNDVFVSDDLLETSGSSSIVDRASQRLSSTSLSVRNRVEKIRTKCLPTWANVKTFVAVICILIAVHGALATGYTMSVITTIEKRFEISSKTSGLIVSSYEFGSLLSVIFVSYFGSNAHIPRVIGLGGLVLAAGSFLFSLPHFIAPNYVPSNSSGGDLAPDVCVPNKTTVRMSPAPACTDGHDEVYVFVLMMAQILLGIGGTPLFTLGTTYIDNHVDKDNSSVYLAFMYVSMALGPVLGFLMGAVMLSEYVNAKVPEFLTTTSPDWVGLWWGGFIVCGALYAVSSLPFFLFPRRLTNKRANEEDSEYGRSWRKIPNSIHRLLTNSVYMAATLNACIELAIVTGFTVFLPKYLETQFGVSTSNASVLTGAVAVPGACVGIFFGGWIMKRLKLELQGVATLIILVNAVAMVLMIGFFLFGCQTVHIAGVTAGYKYPGSSNLDTGIYNMTDRCNSDCHCSLDELQYKKICGVDGLVYMSPCFAGCKVATPTVRNRKSLVGEFTQKRYEYSECSCIVPPMLDEESSTTILATTTSSPSNENASAARLTSSMSMASDGTCEDDCGMLVPFMILVFVISLAASNNQMPIVMVTLRSVSTQEKAFALGVQVVILRLLSYIPSPIIYGDVIDNTCVMWNKKCNGEPSNCLVYDIDGFRTRFASLSMGLMVVGVGLTVLLWFCIRRRYTPFSPPVTMTEIAHRFGDHDNLHITRSKLRSWVSDDSLVNNRPHTPRHQKTRSC